MKDALSTLEASYTTLMREDESDCLDIEAFLERHSKIIDTYEELITQKYIAFQRDTANQLYEEELDFVQTNIKPLLSKFKHEMDQKTLQYIGDKPDYIRLREKLNSKQKSYSESNTAVRLKEDQLVNRYLKITGGLTSPSNQNQDLNDLYSLLYDKNEDVRERAFCNIALAYGGIEQDVNLIFDQLINLRIKKADNVGLNAFSEYAFTELGRTDYTPKNCREIAGAIKQYFLPIKEKLQREQENYLGKKYLSPWDSKVSPYSDITNVYGDSEDVLLETVGNILRKIDPYFYTVFNELHSKRNFDLKPRANKAPGGFSEFLPASRESFIFMNLTGTFDDLVILMHEIGHTIHHDLIKDIPFSEDKRIKMEVAEFAAMSLELLSMEHWNLAVTDQFSLYQAKMEHFRLIVEFLPQTIIVDQFQDWVYHHPTHSHEERRKKFESLTDMYDTGLVDWGTVSAWKGQEWMSVIHIFETPFYYIEYAIAQIAALQLFMNYKKNPMETLERFKRALAMGNSRSVTEIYELAGVKFDFSEATLHPLTQFITSELEAIHHE